jgi:fibronectin-binding autotransporter adhesin
MGTPLTGSTVASTYTGLLKTTDNATLTSSLKALSDGSGNDSALQVSTVASNINGDFSVATNKFTVASASGNTAVAGTLAVTGATSLSSLITSGNATIGGTLGITGGLTIPGTLSVTGISTLTGAVGMGSTLNVTGLSTLASLGVTGAATVGTTLGVTGLSTLASLAVTGASTLDSLAVTNAATIGTTLGVTGLSTLASVSVTGAATVGSTLGVTGNTTLTGDLAANGNTTLGNFGTDTLTLNSDNITVPNISTVTVDLANDKVLITDANDSSKVKLVTVGSIGINSSNAPQCVQQVADDRYNYTGSLTGPGTEITSVTRSITPRSTSSKILVSIVLNYSALVNASQFILFRVTRNGTEIGTSIGTGQKGIASGSYEDGEVNAINNTKIEFLDSPSSSTSTTYKVHIFTPLSVTNLYLNYAINGGSSFTTISTMTLQEFFA